MKTADGGRRRGQASRNARVGGQPAIKRPIMRILGPIAAANPAILIRFSVPLWTQGLGGSLPLGNTLNLHLNGRPKTTSAQLRNRNVLFSLRGVSGDGHLMLISIPYCPELPVA